MKFIDEPVFEPFARIVRFMRGSLYIPRTKPLVLVDMGCGPKLRFFHFARRIGLRFKTYIGIDPLIEFGIISAFRDNPAIRLVKKHIGEKIPLPSDSIDCIMAFAYLEHIDNPRKIVNDMIRVVRPGGVIVLTTPSELSRPLLEFLTYKLHMISKREIDQHKQYFTREKLVSLVSPSNLRKVTLSHRYFELYLNNLFIIKKHEA
jgi:SAM-dependent methyltransferase